MVNYPIGELVQARVREIGRDARSTSGSSTTACAGRTSRRSTATAATASARRSSSTTGRTRPVALLKPGDFDWAAIFARGVRWFHSGGIFASLSETTAQLIIEGMQAAKAAGAITSFDLNYRAKLWASVGGAEKGQQVMRKIAGRLDALIGNEEDLQKGLGIAGPDVDVEVEARPRDVLRHDRAGGRAVPQHQAGRDHPARGPLDQPPRLGGRALARRPAVRQPDAASSTSSTASAAATASPRASSTACSPAGPRGGPPPRLGARRLADHLPRRRHHGPAATRSRRSPRADRPACSAEAVEAASRFAIKRRRPRTMLTAEGCASRRGRLWETLASTCDVLVVGDPSHLNYFAGYAPIAVRLPDGRVGGPAPARAGSGDARGRQPARSRSSTGRSPTRWSPRPGTRRRRHAPAPRRDARRVGARSPRRRCRGDASASSWPPSRRASSRACARHAPTSRSSTSARSSGPCGGRRTPTRSRP